MTTKLEDYTVFPMGPPMSGGVMDPESLGYVYVIGFEEPDVVKIGAARSLVSRLVELQCGNPFELQLKAAVSIYQGDIFKVESAAHKLAREHCIRGEWFNLSVDEAIGCIIQAARNRKARFGPHARAFNAVEQAHKARIAAEDAERRQRMRRALGMDETNEIAP